MFRKVQHIHFTGIGGAGMSGIAEILLNMKYYVSGSDNAASERTAFLESLGGKIYRGHDARFIKGADVLVYSSAISDDNVEIIAAKEKKIPVIARAEMLAELMRLKYGIAVAGAHGKTTTTTMIATLLSEGQLDPTAVIGGKVNSFDGHAKKGEGDFLVAEADESDGSFLKLSPSIAIVTNLDNEHLDYYQTFENLCATFLDFMNKVPFYGLVIFCADDPILQKMTPQIERRALSYGTSENAELRAKNIVYHPGKSSFEVYFQGEPLGHFELPTPGQHNVLNALAAIAVGIELDLPATVIRDGIAAYSGVQRRFQVQGEREGVLVVDDYAHHPTEILAAIDAAKTGWHVPLLVVFQPHRYTRTRDCFETLATAFEGVDQLILTDIYAAGEAPISGITGETFYKKVCEHRKGQTHFLKNFEDIVQKIKKIAQPDMMLLTLGAGNIWEVGKTFLADTKQD
ncbi:UDP-N-acetylmuramate--L-alanine ligase [hydrothermal vent metagenome]|uniref:UDP-N-acetylmuramate--L-alanine ligase n=1 Tax=hydrothermal vent metagenome TaxID=652676 RepID=A0A3B1CD58_9ZZZZ